jgi:4'-phosphopantetheinyl transferase EntD
MGSFFVSAHLNSPSESAPADMVPKTGRVIPRTDEDPALTDALALLAQPGMSTGHRIIAKGDDTALLAEELQSFDRSVEMVRRRSGAARLLARRLLVSAGFDPVPLPRSHLGAPVWPDGVVGSLAHDEVVAVAALAGAHVYEGIGIDIEPALALPLELVAMVATRNEIRRYSTDLIQSRTLFAIKEAVYKALNPLDGVFLDFHDIEIDFENGLARTCQRRNVKIAFTASPRIIALAWLVHERR